MQGKNKPSTISQIDELKLPKRSFNRRSIYMGENVFCWVKDGVQVKKAEVIDMSSRGIAVIRPQSAGDEFKGASLISVEFNRGTPQRFAIDSKVSNITDVRYNHKDYKRIGIHFSMRSVSNVETFNQSISKPTFGVRSSICPQVVCVDPFFFNEVVLFQVLSFTAEGMVLAVSARNKTILPNQPLELEVYVPGRGAFYVAATSSDLFCETSDDRYRLYVTYNAPVKEYLEAISEHLVMFSPDASPARLRKAGFTVGNMTQAIAIHYAKARQTMDAKLQTSLISMPDPRGKSRSVEHSRLIVCKLGPFTAAQLNLTFVENDPRHSTLALSYQKAVEAIKAGPTVELVDFYAHPEVSLVDFLVPLLRHIIRIAYQAQMQHLLLEAASPMVAVLKRLGFKELSKRNRTGTGDARLAVMHLVQMNINDVIDNKGLFLPVKLWAKVYKDLSKYLKKHAETANLIE